MVSDCAYASRARAVKVEDVSSDEGNREILRRLRDHDPRFIKLLIKSGDASSGSAVYSSDSGVGWLGYHIGYSKHLRTLYLYSSVRRACECDLKLLWEGICRNRSIRKVLLQDFSGGNVFAMLGSFFENNRNMTELVLRECRLGEVGCRCLSVVIAGCAKSLKRFTLYNHEVELGNGDLLADVFVALGTCPQLEKLQLLNTSLGRRSCVSLSMLVDRMNKMHTLNLGDSMIGDEGLQSMAEVLPGCHSLRTLNLRNNSIGDVGAKALKRALAHSKLQSLILSENSSITLVGWKSISTLLENQNSELKELGLCQSNIGDEAVVIFASALLGNNKLEKMELLDNDVGAVGWSAISRLLCDGSSISRIRLSNHTLQWLWIQGPVRVSELLDLNKSSLDTSQIAMIKILR